MPARPGERHHKAKLTEDDVREIRRRRAAGETVVAIWIDYPQINSPATVDQIGRRETWRHVT